MGVSTSSSSTSTTIQLDGGKKPKITWALPEDGQSVGNREEDQDLRGFVHVDDMYLSNELVSAEVIEKATEEANVLGIGRAIKDGLEDEGQGLGDSDEDHLESASPKDVDGDITSDEEPELPGVMRPKFGDGW